MAPKRQTVSMPAKRRRTGLMRESTAGRQYSIKATRRQNPDFPKLFSTSMWVCNQSVRSDLGIPGEDRMKKVQLWLQYEGPIENGTSSSNEDEGSLKEVEGE